MNNLLTRVKTFLNELFIPKKIQNAEKKNVVLPYMG